MRIIVFLYLLGILDAFLYASDLIDSHYSIYLFGFYFGCFELITWFVFIIFFISWALKSKKNKASIFKKNYGFNTLITFLFFATLTQASIIGYVEENKYLSTSFRNLMFIIPAALLPAMLVRNIPSAKKVVFCDQKLLPLLICLVVLVGFYSESFIRFYSVSVSSVVVPDPNYIALSGGYGAYSLTSCLISIVLYFGCVSRVLFGVGKLIDYIGVLASALSVVVYFHKPIVVCFVLGNAASLFIFLNMKPNKVEMCRILSLVAFALFLITLTLIFSAEYVTSVWKYIEYGWLNIGRAGVEDDLSTGRFDLYREYILYSLHGWGFTANGIGFPLESAMFPTPHNYFIYLAYELGVLFAICLLLYILNLWRRSYVYIKTNKTNTNSNALRVYTLLVIQITIFTFSFYSGILDANKQYIFVFFASLVLTNKLINDKSHA